MPSVCILRLSAIGDVCHAVAMAERIQRQAPDVSLTWIIGKVEYQLVKNIPGIEFIVFDKSQGSDAFKHLRQAMRNRKFDVLLAMQVAFRANLAAAMIPARKKFGYDWARSKELHWLFTNARISPQRHAHVLDSFMAFADALALPDSGRPQWPCLVDDSLAAWAKEQIGHLGKFAVICPAASKPERNWLPERYAAVADYLLEKGVTPILCGGPAAIDRELGLAIESHSDAPGANLIGKTSLLQLLAILQEATLVVAPDTGPAHMATMVNTDVIGLYAHSNPRRTGPYNNLDDVVSVYESVVQEQHGKPWQELPWGTRVKGDDLMSRITTDMVCSKIEQVLARA